MLTRGARARPEARLTPEEVLKEPYVLEFLGLKDEYSETDLEEALIRHLETFLLELARASRSWAVSGAFALATPGIASTCCSFTGDCAAWS